MKIPSNLGSLRAIGFIHATDKTEDSQTKALSPVAFTPAMKSGLEGAYLSSTWPTLAHFNAILLTGVKEVSSLYIEEVLTA